MEIQKLPAAFFRTRSVVASSAAHTAIGRIHNELRSASMAEIVADLFLGSSGHGASCRSGFWSFVVPMLIVEHGLPIAALSLQRIHAHREIPDMSDRTYGAKAANRQLICFQWLRRLSFPAARENGESFTVRFQNRRFRCRGAPDAKASESAWVGLGPAKT